jgi:hypothetical protein
MHHFDDQPSLLPNCIPMAPQFSLRNSDVELMFSCGVVVASDVIYDGILSLHLLPRFGELLDTLNTNIYITLEKRIVFTTQKQAPHAPAIDFFMSYLIDMNRHRIKLKKRMIHRRVIDTSSFTLRFLKGIDTSQLELWQLSLK